MPERDDPGPETVGRDDDRVAGGPGSGGLVGGDEVARALADEPVGAGRRVRAVVVRLVVTVVALAISGALLVSVFDDLDWASVWDSITSLGDAERLALVGGAGMAIAAQGLVTASTIPRLPVRRGVLAYLGPAAVASLVPGPSDLPLRYRMYASWGYTPAEAGLAVVTSGIFSMGTKLVLPVLAAVTAFVGGVTLDDGFSGMIVVAGIVLGVLIVVTSLVLGSDRLSALVAYWMEAPWRVATRLVRRGHRPLGEVLEAARDTAVSTLADRWAVATWAAFLYTAAQVGLMVMAVRFTGVPEDAIGATGVFVAFGIVQGLTVLPITAGNVGVAETAWIGLLGAMAGAEWINEITAAVLIYRLLTWVAIIPLGGLAVVVWRRSLSRARPSPPGGPVSEPAP